MWITTDGKISKGHGVAGAKSEHYPAGTIQLQTGPFKEAGVDISGYYPATLNIDISPAHIKLVLDEVNGAPVANTFFNVHWTNNHPPETFSFSQCWLRYQDIKYPGLIYYPHPETKTRHEQKSGIVEVLCKKIPLAEGKNDIEIAINSLEFHVQN